MKLFSCLFICVGIFLILTGGYEWLKTEKAQRSNLSEATKLLFHSQSNDPLISEIIKIPKFEPEIGEVIGILSIPVIDAELPIVEGTEGDNLEKGVGHYKGTSFPGQKDQIVLSGHRDTVFRRMGELKVHDKLTVNFPYGTFTYQVESMYIVKADDLSVIKSTAPEEQLVLTTCYPFSFIGNAPERYIIIAYPFESK